MSDSGKGPPKGPKTGKTSLLGTFVSPGNSKLQISTVVPPVLREVSKLAAGVASVSTLATSSGSATGNPRNKVALQPGHSLMDWIRLGASGKDLTGQGARAGTLSITKRELANHNRRSDAWLAIRGKVYNVTEYFPFHPGGEAELMRGVGIDATSLFDEVHPWVNYEQILNKCLVGRLVAAELEGLKRAAAPPSPTAPREDPPLAQLPRFDWIQKIDYITVIFYTKAFCNPLVEVAPPINDQTVTVSIGYRGTAFANELTFHDKVRWPCEVGVSAETGKVELVFRKFDGAVWANHGVLRQSTAAAAHPKSHYVLRRKAQVNHNSWVLTFGRRDGKIVVLPVGKHVRVYGTDLECSRSYTPIPAAIFDHSGGAKGEELCLLVKRYREGNLSRLITDRRLGDQMEISAPLGSFDLKVVEKRETFLMVAAGTGLTPMLGLIVFLLERRVQKCQFIRLLFFNRAEQDVLLGSKLSEIARLDKRFKLTNILSEAEPSWSGLRGRVNPILVQTCLQEHLQDTGYSIKDIFGFICGPPKFNEAAAEVLQGIGILQYHTFDG